MGLFDRFRKRNQPIEGSNKLRDWQPPLEGATTPPGTRPESWMLKEEKPEGAKILVTSGDKDGKHETKWVSPTANSNENKG